jgi:LytR cell envelope-related transcriptional attenuator
VPDDNRPDHNSPGGPSEPDEPTRYFISDFDDDHFDEDQPVEHDQYAESAEHDVEHTAQQETDDAEDIAPAPQRFFFDDLAPTESDDGDDTERYAGVGAAAGATIGASADGSATRSTAGGASPADSLGDVESSGRRNQRGQRVVGGVLIALVAAAVLVVIGARLGGSGDDKKVVGGVPTNSTHASTSASTSPTAPKTSGAKTSGATTGGAKTSTAPTSAASEQPSTGASTSPGAGRSSAPMSSSAAGSSVPATSGAPSSGTPSTPPSSAGAPSGAVVHAPLTVLNNTTTQGLAGQAADVFSGKGWTVNDVSNYTGNLATTTVFYDPSDPAQQRAARSLAAQFPAITAVQPRINDLPGKGLTVVLAPNWS